MYLELAKRLRDAAKMSEALAVLLPHSGGNVTAKLYNEAADAIEKLQKTVLRLEEESGILDELPMVDQSTPCDTCVHKGNVDFDYCHICNNETDMYKPKPPKEE